MRSPRRSCLFLSQEPAERIRKIYGFSAFEAAKKRTAARRGCRTSVRSTHVCSARRACYGHGRTVLLPRDNLNGWFAVLDAFA